MELKKKKTKQYLYVIVNSNSDQSKSHLIWTRGCIGNFQFSQNAKQHNRFYISLQVCKLLIKQIQLVKWSIKDCIPIMLSI